MESSKRISGLWFERLLMRMTKKLNMLLRTKGFGSPEVRKASKQLRATLQDSQVRGVSIKDYQ